MVQRLEPLVKLRKGQLEVAFPDEPDADARRDGLTNSAPSRLGTRAWWLVQLVSGTPLSFWTAKTSMAPAELVNAHPPDAVQLGWASAAERQRDVQWAALLFTKRPSPGLLSVLPPAEAAALAETVLASTPSDAAKAPLLYGLLDAVSAPWPEALSRVAVEGYRHVDPFSIQKAAGLLSARLDPAVAPLVEQWATTLADGRARREVRNIHHALTLRRTIAEEFA
jgi:hypothetical protein